MAVDLWRRVLSPSHTRRGCGPIGSTAKDLELAESEPKEPGDPFRRDPRRSAGLPRGVIAVAVASSPSRGLLSASGRCRHHGQAVLSRRPVRSRTVTPPRQEPGRGPSNPTATSAPEAVAGRADRECIKRARGAAALFIERVWHRRQPPASRARPAPAGGGFALQSTVPTPGIGTPSPDDGPTPGTVPAVPAPTRPPPSRPRPPTTTPTTAPHANRRHHPPRTHHPPRRHHHHRPADHRPTRATDPTTEPRTDHRPPDHRAGTHRRPPPPPPSTEPPPTEPAATTADHGTDRRPPPEPAPTTTEPTTPRRPPRHRTCAVPRSPTRRHGLRWECGLGRTAGVLGGPSAVRQGAAPAVRR